eukprot:scaffold2.g7309.t1
MFSRLQAARRAPRPAAGSGTHLPAWTAGLDSASARQPPPHGGQPAEAAGRGDAAAGRPAEAAAAAPAVAAAAAQHCARCAELEGRLAVCEGERASVQQRAEALELRLDNLLRDRARLEEEMVEAQARLAAQVAGAEAAHALAAQRGAQLEAAERRARALEAAAAAAARGGGEAGAPRAAAVGADPGRASPDDDEACCFLTARSAAPTSANSSAVTTARVRGLGAEHVTWGRTLTARPPVPRPPSVPAVSLSALLQRSQQQG